MLHTALWDDVAAIAAMPVLLWIIATGLGLLAERLARQRLDNALLAPLGFCVALSLTLGIYTTGAGNSIALPLLLVAVLAGFLLQRRDLRSRLNPGWPLLAGLAAYVLFNLSVIAAGHWTFTGYNFENDSAYEMLLVDYLKVHGTHLVVMKSSTSASALNAYLQSGYPLGSQSLLAALSGLLGTSVAVIWQGFISAMAAIGAMALAMLSGRMMDRRLAALAGFVAMSAALTYQYALQGSIKEIAVTVAVLSSLAITRFAILQPRGVRGAVALCAIPLAAVLSAYSAAGIPYAAALAGSGVLGLLLVHRRLPTRAWIAPALIGGVTLAVFCAPALNTISTFLHVSLSGYTGAHASAPQLGPLFRALPLSELSGVWLFGDYRLPVPHGHANQLTVLATVVIFALLVAGVARLLLRREPGPLMGLVTMGLVLLIVYPRSIPYAQAKLLAIASPIVVLGAAQGISWLRTRTLLPLAALLSGGIGATVLGSSALAYHSSPVAPTERMLALRQAEKWLHGKGPVLDSEFEQFAKYFMQGAYVYVATDSPTPVPLELRSPQSQYDRSFDLDSETLPFVESFPYILTRVSPAASRPPANYRLIAQNPYYAAWRRLPVPRVLAHLPLQSPISAQAPVQCAALGALVSDDAAAAAAATTTATTAAAATTSAMSLVVASHTDSYGFQLKNAATRSRGWPLDPSGAAVLGSPGAASKSVVIPHGGAYRIWVQGTLPRRITVKLDGRKLGTVGGVNTPDEWLDGGAVTVAPGRHTLEVLRPGGSLVPGDGGSQGRLVAVALSTESPRRTHTFPIGQWRRLCGQPADWVELTRP
ncbi:MAG TPA: hypothetical protein VLJ42_10570 [Solirubrobacteraceae bacterium]|nr:hypothetical protein [Solirubrobacteraceae bacterium]